MRRYDAVIVGAGPAGCTAALKLAQGGAAVALIDKAVLPRYKTCGGGLLRRAYRLLPQSVEQVVERSFNSIELNFLDRGLQFETRRAEPIVYMTMRADLDDLLARAARDVGADVLQDCAANGVRRHGGIVEVETSKGSIIAKAVIAADGANSRTARAAGWTEKLSVIPALEYEVFVSAREFERVGGGARFDFGVITDGYAWIFPKRRHLSVGILTMRRRSVNLHQELATYLNAVGVREIQSVERHGHTIPIAPRKGRLAKDGVFLVGDAAGLADPVTAEGISFAISSGQFAAEAILKNSSVSDAAEMFQDVLAKKILPELRAARGLAAILYRWPLLRDLSFRLSGQKLCEFMTDLVTGDASYGEAIAKPSSYLKALGLR